jgi:hypothetical protein
MRAWEKTDPSAEAYSCSLSFFPDNNSSKARLPSGLSFVALKCGELLYRMLPHGPIYRRSRRHASADTSPASPRNLLKNSLLKGTLAAGW